MPTSFGKIYLKIADFYIQIEFNKTLSKYNKTRIVRQITSDYKGFIFPLKPSRIDYTVEFVEHELIHAFHKQRTKYYINYYYIECKNKITTFYYISRLELGFILKDILTQLLANNQGIVLHSSANLIDNKATLFIGEKGSGKSTIMVYLHNKYKALANDTIFLRHKNKSVLFYQTPFYEKEWRVHRDNKAHQLGRIYFIRKAQYFRIEKITNKNRILSLCIKHTVPNGKNIRSNEIKTLIKIASSFNDFYYFYFDKNKNNLLQFLCKVRGTTLTEEKIKVY